MSPSAFAIVGQPNPGLCPRASLLRQVVFGILLAGEQMTAPTNLGVHRQVCNTVLFTWISFDIQSTCPIVASVPD